MTEVNLEDVQALIELFDASQWDELHIVSKGFEIHLSNDPADRGRLSGATALAPAPLRGDAAASTAHTGPSTPTSPARPAPRAVAPQAPQAQPTPAGHVTIRAGSLGTFYMAPKPGAKPYVEIGQRVQPDTDVCVIEVMKLFTSVQAGVTGVVRQVLVKDAELVEFDQPLFLIEVTE
ncbi:biotin/lipoyl-containing protein [Methylibium sp.]|uniref:acetyl-CoA carboxylase biotin carboxyl carrier protein n=1 Tax=Methylibium sp. TaxID=2067992 RepID=UPI00286C299D|nr:biotin/lipoyl-containing protein [Methylibium sp.]